MCIQDKEHRSIALNMVKSCLESAATGISSMMAASHIFNRKVPPVDVQKPPKSTIKLRQ